MRDRVSLRERGASLLEAALATALAGSLLALGHALLSAASERQRDEATGRAFALVAGAAQRYVAEHYAVLRDGLAALPAGPALRQIDPADLTKTGQFNAVLVSRPNSYGQAYRLLVRGVDVTGGKTLTDKQIDSDSDGKVDEHLRDDMIDNGELALEAILVSSGGQALSRVSGGRAVDAARNVGVGFVIAQGTAHGAHGAWQMDLTPYSSLDGYPGAGHMAALVALPGYGVLDRNGDAAANHLSYPLERCVGVEGDQLADCAGSNEIHATVAFAASGEGAMDGLRSLTMADPEDDAFSLISELSELACGGGAAAGQAAKRLLVTCDEIVVSGDIDAEGTITGERFFADALAGQDLTQGIYGARIVAMLPPPTITRPACQSPAKPEIFAAPVSFVSPGGVPLVGVAALATAGEDDWSVKMIASIAADTDNDGKSDEVALSSMNDFALVLTRCG